MIAFLMGRFGIAAILAAVLLPIMVVNYIELERSRAQFSTCQADSAKASNEALLGYLSKQDQVNVTAGAENAAALARIAASAAAASKQQSDLKTYAAAHPLPVVCAIDPERVRDLNAAGRQDHASPRLEVQ